MTDQRYAKLARVTVEIGRERADRYVFDVGVTDRGRSLLDALARRWVLRDAYRSDEQPLIMRFRSDGQGSK